MSLQGFQIENGFVAAAGKAENMQPGFIAGHAFIPLVTQAELNKSSIYKCSSVDSVNKTWIGFLYYDSFQESESVTLSYVYKAPSVGKYYNENASVECDVFTPSGLVFYAPLTSDSLVAETGQTMQKTGSITYTVKDNIPCAHFNLGSLKTVNMTGIPSGNQPWTISCWMNIDTIVQITWPWILYCGNLLWREKRSFGFMGFNDTGEKHLVFKINEVNGTNYEQGIIAQNNTWYVFTATFDGSTLNFYVDGVSVYTHSGCSFNIANDFLSIGCGDTMDNSISNSFQGYIAGVRIYNRAIAPSEVQKIAMEYTPSV